jgi:hypothetical protein
MHTKIEYRQGSSLNKARVVGGAAEFGAVEKGDPSSLFDLAK